MSRTLLFAIGLTALATAPATAVGLGPLRKEGLTDGPAKGFYLTVINPEARAETYTLSALAPDSEDEAPNVTIFPSRVTIGRFDTRKVLVIANQLAPGSSTAFRVCAEGAFDPRETVHARVCSNLVARRVQPRG